MLWDPGAQSPLSPGVPGVPLCGLHVPSCYGWALPPAGAMACGAGPPCGWLWGLATAVVGALVCMASPWEEATSVGGLGGALMPAQGTCWIWWGGGPLQRSSSACWGHLLGLVGGELLWGADPVLAKGTHWIRQGAGNLKEHWLGQVCRWTRGRVSHASKLVKS